MKLFFISVVVFCLIFSFCTKDSPTQVISKSEYTDSIVVDLYAYSMWFFQKNVNYYGPLNISAKGQSLLKTPLDPNTEAYNSGSMIYPIFVPKYPPSQFEAFVYDSIPLVETDSLNSELLVKSYSNSRTYMFCLDTTKGTDSILNIEKCISRPDISYIYGFGFWMDYTKWGLGKIKIYYK
jgi:hypothetical protein